MSTGKTDLSKAVWPMSRLTEAVRALARCVGLPVANSPMASAPPKCTGAEGIANLMSAASAACAVELEPVDAAVVDCARLLRGAAPALLRIKHQGEDMLLLLLACSARTVFCVGPEHTRIKLPMDAVVTAVAAHALEQVPADIELLLQHAGMAARHRAKSRAVLQRAYLAQRRVEGCWMLRKPATAPWRLHFDLNTFARRAGVLLLVFCCIYAMEIGAWTLIGQAALAGRVNTGWLAAWALVLCSIIPLQLAGFGLQAKLAIDAGVLLKQRIMAGIARMNLDEVRGQGAGQWLGRVIETQSIDAMAINGGLSTAIALVELGFAGWILSQGAGGALHVVSLLAWWLAALFLSAHYYRRLRRWTHTRLSLTHLLVEKMIGHRTRLAQENSQCRHLDEDQAMDHFGRLSRELDRAYVPLMGGLPRGWMLLGTAGLAPAFVFGAAQAVDLAIGVGGIMLAYRAFSTMSLGLSAVSRAAICWTNILPFLTATRNSSQNEHSPIAMTRENAPIAAELNEERGVVLHAQDVVFSHRLRQETVLAGCNLTIRRGDRLLLEGPSGGGKSTLAALLSGLHRPHSGMLLLNGLDQTTWGETWRQIATAAPQTHENHVFTGSLAFNLLLGRGWPASGADLADAQKICEELGLGELIKRMPAGLMQMIGESGWQLSHGERSRMYLARALLQNSELIVLDESFAALDPATLRLCLNTTLARASTLVVIAHP